MANAPRKPEVDFKALTECSSDVVLQISPDNELLYVSPAVFDVLGWTPSEIMRHHSDLLYEEDRDRVLQNAEALQFGKRQSSMSAFRVYKRDGSLLWMEGAAHRLTTENGEANGIVLTMRDISERMALKAELEALARTDGLTGLVNRRTFDEMLEREWAIARREKTHLSLLICDLDHFKSVNDRYGHQVGDDCLKAVANVLKSTARRPADVVARYGGEELSLILPNTHEDGAKTIGEYIRIAVEDLRIPNEGNPEHRNVVTMSVGAATALCLSGGSHTSQESLLTCADQALYKAKSQGRNRVEFSMLLVKEPTP